MENLSRRRVSELRKEIRFTHRVYKIILLILVIIIGVQRFQLSIQADKVNMYEPISIEAQADTAETHDFQVLDDKDLDTFNLPELPKHLQK